MCNAFVVVVGTEGGEQRDACWGPEVAQVQCSISVYYSPIMAGIRKSTLMSEAGDVYIGERPIEYYETCSPARRIVFFIYYSCPYYYVYDT